MLNNLDFSCSSASKESACNAGDPSSIPRVGKSPGEGVGYPLQYSGLENSMDFFHYMLWSVIILKVDCSVLCDRQIGNKQVSGREASSEAVDNNHLSLQSGDGGGTEG